MYMLILIGIGGFIGAIFRYLISGWIQNNSSIFPLGTISVNFIGSFFLGFVMYLSEYLGMFDEKTRVFLTIGVLGAFTTMSTFGYESFKMFEQGEWMMFSINILATVVLTILAVYLSKQIVIGIVGVKV